MVIAISIKMVIAILISMKVIRPAVVTSIKLSRGFLCVRFMSPHFIKKHLFIEISVISGSTISGAEMIRLSAVVATFKVYWKSTEIIMILIKRMFEACLRVLSCLHRLTGRPTTTLRVLTDCLLGNRTTLLVY